MTYPLSHLYQDPVVVSRATQKDIPIIITASIHHDYIVQAIIKGKVEPFDLKQEVYKSVENIERLILEHKIYLCGYVGVDKAHPFYGIHYDKLESNLTYSGELLKLSTDPILWYFGFDTAVFPGLLFRTPLSLERTKKRCVELYEALYTNSSFKLTHFKRTTLKAASAPAKGIK